jgi:hypothetical protein
MYGVMKDQLKTSKEILEHLSRHGQKYEEPNPKHDEARIPEQKEAGKKSSFGKPTEIVVGS